MTNDMGSNMMNMMEVLNVRVRLNWTSCSPAIHQRKNLSQVAAASSAQVPDRETGGADLNSASGRVVPADCQTHKQGEPVLVVSQ